MITEKRYAKKDHAYIEEVLVFGVSSELAEKQIEGEDPIYKGFELKEANDGKKYKLISYSNAFFSTKKVDLYTDPRELPLLEDLELYKSEGQFLAAQEYERKKLREESDAIVKERLEKRQATIKMISKKLDISEDDFLELFR